MFNPRVFKPTFHGVPTIKIKQKCLEDMWHLVQIVGMEVGWLVVTHETEDGDFVLSEVVLPDQNCHGATTELNEQGLADAAMRLIDEDSKAGIQAKDPGFRANHLSTWCHSHVDMGVSPSGQDDAQMEQFCKMYAGDQDAWIRGILNKKGDAEFTVYFQCGKSWKPIKDVPWEVIPDVENERFKFWRGIVDQRVKGFTEPVRGAYVPMGVPLAGEPPYKHGDFRDRSKEVIVPTRHPRGGSGRRKEWWT